MDARRLWQPVYRQRMSEGLEYCRACINADADTFGHLIPASQGGTFSFKNITLLCFACNQLQADNIWPWLESLKVEERRAPRRRRWFELAQLEHRRTTRLSYRMDLSNVVDLC